MFCGGRLKFYRRVDARNGKAKVSHDYICPNSEAYGEQFCRKKKIKMQDLEEAVEAALCMHIKLLLDTREALNYLNHTVQAKAARQDYKKQISDTRGSQDMAQIMEQYSDFKRTFI